MYIWECRDRCRAGILSVLADQSTTIATPEFLIGQGVDISHSFVNLEEVAHAASRRECPIESNNSIYAMIYSVFINRTAY